MSAAMSSSHGPSTLADRRSPDTIITHPNRDKPVVQATRATVVLLILVTAALILINTIGGWSELEGAVPIQIIYFFVYLLMAFYAGRWRGGVLPVCAALAVVLGILALLAGPGWFERNKAGFAQPALNAGLLGVLTLLIIPVQMLLVAFAMRGFKQGWNVEQERRDPAAGADLYPEAPPHPA